jgi:phage baseplate assembly protein W
VSFNFATVALPWDGTLQGFLELKNDQDVIRSAVLWIVMTRKGERVMLPNFGTIVPDQVFEPLDLQFELDVESDVRDALLEFEDRIEFHGIDIVRDADNNRATGIITFVNSLDPLQKELQELRVSPTLTLAR